MLGEAACVLVGAYYCAGQMSHSSPLAKYYRYCEAFNKSLITILRVLGR